jgi:metal-sulfur cluster biosynthetic enzyme
MAPRVPPDPPDAAGEHFSCCAPGRSDRAWPAGQPREGRLASPQVTGGAMDTATTSTEAPAFDAERRATELAILDALRNVVDPEIGMNVVELALIKQILIGKDESEIKMILTTPFCPYAGSMVAQVQEQAEAVLEHPVKVTLLAERWDPRDAGLMW